MDEEQREVTARKTSKEMGSIIVIGGGGHAKVVISILRKLRRYRILGYTDLRNCSTLLDVPYLGNDSAILEMTGETRARSVALGVGQVGLGKRRQEIWARLRSAQMSFPSVISPDAIVNEDVILGDGVVVMDGAVINPGAKLGLGVIANTHCTIEHDVTLADWVHVAPGATISGGVTIGQFSMVGAGAIVIEGKTIAAEIIVGAGATVVDDLTEPGVYVGTPARRIT